MLHEPLFHSLQKVVRLPKHHIAPLNKVEALNNQFFTFFTDEDTLSSNLEPSFPLTGDLC